jgi:hypothetical protein
MREFKWFVDLNKEAQYLKHMAEKGYRLKAYDIFGFYHFVATRPTSSDYRIDYRLFFCRVDYENYLAMFEDAGWEHVAGSGLTGEQIFLSKEGMSQTEDIYSDKKSKAGRYKRALLALVHALVGFMFELLVIFKVLASTKPLIVPQPENWLHTSGLQEQFGIVLLLIDGLMAFATFLFALLIIFSIVFIAICSIGYLIIAVRTFLLYRKEFVKKSDDDKNGYPPCFA